MHPSAVHPRPYHQTQSDDGTDLLGDKSRVKPLDSTASPARLQGEAYAYHVINCVRTVILPGLVNRQDLYLKDKELTKLGIRVTGFGLKTGQAYPFSSTSEQFLRHVDESAITELLGSRGPSNRD